MTITPPFSFKKWIDENRHLLKPPVGNQVVYKPNQDFIVMVVGGPNSRKDFHYNETEEFYYQLEGDIVVRIMQDGKPLGAGAATSDPAVLSQLDCASRKLDALRFPSPGSWNGKVTLRR